VAIACGAFVSSARGNLDTFLANHAAQIMAAGVQPTAVENK